MVYLLAALCAVFFLVLCLLFCKIHQMRRAAEEIRLEFSARLKEDTNIGIDISCGDRAMRRLAAGIDHELKLLRRRQLSLEQGDRDLKEAVTNISHDLRTPLTAICGYMELLDREEKSPAVREYLKIIDNRIEALKELTEELFRYFVVTSTDSYEERELLSLSEVLEESIAGFYGTLKGRGIEPAIRLPERLVKRRLNRAALSRIFSNIISNAVKYSGGDLSVTLSEDGVIQFSNLAPSLNEVMAGRLFDRFYTVESARRSTGLGLSIAKTLTEQQGGVIHCAYEKGRLTLTLRFPSSL
jgi:signal transduction histidine kinase